MERKWCEPFNLVSPNETSPSATRLNYQRNNLSQPPRGHQRGNCVCFGNKPESDGRVERPERPPPSSTMDGLVSRAVQSAATNYEKHANKSGRTKPRKGLVV